MGLLVDGKWSDHWYETEATGGRFVRKQSAFREQALAADSTPFAPRRRADFLRENRRQDSRADHMDVVLSLGREIARRACR